ncbi:leukocyte tyrosine kinase receptor [Pelobates cultripes]|uniref:Tyrosine-protein kinase receptor n=1 Tax=Pelobates cultripes TaxID=61616 RepID=A0AAD1WWB4_PELCU|nr:leukocyte tyrosine kinase receptor [Pelobates cultripes]
MAFPTSILIMQMALWTLLLVADWCSGLHAESILTPGLPITSMSASHMEEKVLPMMPQSSGTLCDFEAHCQWMSSMAEDGSPHWVQTMIGALAIQQQIRLLEERSGKGIHEGVLVLNVSRTSETCREPQLLSPVFPGSSRTCFLEVAVYNPVDSLSDILSVMIQSAKANFSLPVLHQKEADSTARLSNWKSLSWEIGEINERFQISLRSTSCGLNEDKLLALDSLNLRNCFEGIKEDDLFHCRETSYFLCENGDCIHQRRLCDFHKDCAGGEDEDSLCDDVLPFGSRCSFEEGTCGWTLRGSAGSSWIRTNSAEINPEDPLSVPLQATGGQFLYLPIHTTHSVGDAMLSSGRLPSVLSKSCQFSFNLFVSGTLNGSLVLYAMDENSLEDIVKLWEQSGSPNDLWSTVNLDVPLTQNRFRLQFLVSWGWNSTVHLAVDNLRFSVDCFHAGRIEIRNGTHGPLLGLYPEEDLHLTPLSEPFHSEEMEWWFGPCGARGPHGPTQSQCDNAYRNSNVSVEVVKDGPLEGIQMWKVPFTDVYKISAYGAAGGKGAKNSNKRSFGVFMCAVFQLQKDEILYILVGQQGEDACPGKNKVTHEICMGISSLIEDKDRENRSLSDWAGGGGGGGGATYVFKKDENGRFIPLLVGAGGGGKAYLQHPEGFPDVEKPEQFNNSTSVPGLNGRSGAAGGGGGWNDITELPWAGRSLLEGGTGGQSCYQALANLQWETSGGFGGGGGACTSGGGGGGYQGGFSSQFDDIYADGENGVSFFHQSGEMFINPLAAVESDGELRIELYLNCSHCDHGSCMRHPIDKKAVCICHFGTVLAQDNTTCIAPNWLVADRPLPLRLILAVIATVVLCLIFACGSLSFVYHRKKKQLEGARVRLQSTEYKLSKIRSSIIMTDYNPNYCFAGKGAGLSELKEVPRKNITLLRALGHGAFGEVYEGLVVGISGDPNPLQVAIKTLPEICSEQDEMDFLMEALIISKFSHQNIVRCIGVSLQTLPRFILLELMSGGDMKSFLRQNRPLVTKPPSLTMLDLLNMARDIACGCKYLEDNQFIHRDIAARNCLLTNSSTGRVAKIGDFGMARDIYRASYYRKGGRAMLPVKWMPPEAFLEGIFTSKTDTWSFGVLLWEIFSLGYMPYPCKTNQEVLEFVTSGGRMDPPKKCPGPVYRIMTQCWQHTPDHRPNFSTIMERIIYCTQDPDVINTELPVESGPTSEDEGNTIMRSNSCNGLTPLVSNPPLLDTQTKEHQLGDFPQELLVDNLVGWNIRSPNLQCITESTEESWIPSSPISTTETKPQGAQKLKNKTKNLWNPTYGSWVMESTC